nr:hypothetical protein [Tanacetum cinerariifolium]
MIATVTTPTTATSSRPPSPPSTTTAAISIPPSFSRQNKGCLFLRKNDPNRVFVYVLYCLKGAFGFAFNSSKGVCGSGLTAPTGAFGFVFNSQMGCLVRCLTTHKGAFGTTAPIRALTTHAAPDKRIYTMSDFTRPAGGLRADYDIVSTMDREIMRDPEREVGYGITDLWDEIVETLQGAPVSTDTELDGYMREFETRVRQNTEEIYMRLDDEQSQMTKIRELQAADRRRQTVILELLRADHGRSTAIIKLRTALQGQVTALQAQVTALQGQQGLAGGPTQPELLEEAGSGS